MRLLTLLEDTTDVVYHGTDRNFSTFSVGAPTSSGVTSKGIFFTQSKEVAQGYGNRVIAARLHMDYEMTFDFAGKSTVYFNGGWKSPSELVNMVAEMIADVQAGYNMDHLDPDIEYELYDVGLEGGIHDMEDVDGIVMNNVDDSMTMFGGEVTTHYVVFSPNQIEVVDGQNVSESFFADNMDVLMPVVRSLMKTGARPLIYKLWKKSPNAVLALAALKRLHDKGDDNPLLTLDKLSDLDVPMQFLKRLAWDAGMHQIPGVAPAGKKPSVQNQMVMASTDLNESGGITAYHTTERENVEDILSNGFLGGWGDVGFGVYLYDNIYDARDYAHDGGWDGELKDPVILKVVSSDLMYVDPDPSWPNPEDYETVCWIELPDDDTRWKPESVSVVDGINEVTDNDPVQVWHVTPTENIPSIRKQGLVPQIGTNSSELGEIDNAIHVFYNKDTMEDAIGNWDMPSWGEEDEVPLTAIEMQLPPSWVEDDPDYPGEIGLVKRRIPIMAFVKFHDNV